jgi:hypothetical protein
VQTLPSALPQLSGIKPFQPMTYSVIIKHHDAFSQAYLQGCEQSFDTEQQAQDYIQTFEDWEQDLLEIDFNPF